MEFYFDSTRVYKVVVLYQSKNLLSTQNTQLLKDEFQNYYH